VAAAASPFGPGHDGRREQAEPMTFRPNPARRGTAIVVAATGTSVAHAGRLPVDLEAPMPDPGPSSDDTRVVRKARDERVQVAPMTLSES
jgi:hypothetical protein